MDRRMGEPTNKMFIKKRVKKQALKSLTKQWVI